MVEGMERHALGVLGQAVVLGEDRNRGLAHDTGYRRGLGQALLLHEQCKRLIAAAAGRYLEHAGFGALGIEHRTDVQALEQRAAAGDVRGQFPVSAIRRLRRSP